MRPGAFTSLRREARQAWNGWRHLLRAEDDAARDTFPTGWNAFWRSLALVLAGISLDALLDLSLSGETLEAADLAVGALLFAGSIGAMLAPALLWRRWRGVLPMLSAQNWLGVFLLPLSLGITLLAATLQRNAGLLERATGMAELPAVLLAFALMGLILWLGLRLAAIMLRLGIWRVALVSFPLLAALLVLTFSLTDSIEPEAGVPLWLIHAFWLVFLLVMLAGMTLLGWLLSWPLRWLARRNSPPSATQA